MLSADAITNQPALSNISVLKKDMFNEHDSEAKFHGSEANVAGNGVVSKANGDISPLTAKKWRMMLHLVAFLFCLTLGEETEAT